MWPQVTGTLASTYVRSIIQHQARETATCFDMSTLNATAWKNKTLARMKTLGRQSSTPAVAPAYTGTVVLSTVSLLYPPRPESLQLSYHFLAQTANMYQNKPTEVSFGLFVGKPVFPSALLHQGHWETEMLAYAHEKNG